MIRRQIRWDFVFNWALMSLIGFVIGMMVRQGILRQVTLILIPLSTLTANYLDINTLIKIIEGATLGLAIGAAHMLAMPPRFTAKGWWVLASVIGWSLGWTVGWSTWQFYGGFAMIFGVVGGLAGLSAGLLQWPLLRRYTKSSYLWIGISPLAWSLGYAAAALVRGAFGWPAAGIVAGAILGVGMAWLFRTSLVDSDLPFSSSSNLSAD